MLSGVRILSVCQVVGSVPSVMPAGAGGGGDGAGLLLFAPRELAEERADLGVALGLARLAGEARQRDRRQDRDEGDNHHELEQGESRLLVPIPRAVHAPNYRSWAAAASDRA